MVGWEGRPETLELEAVLPTALQYSLQGAGAVLSVGTSVTPADLLTVTKSVLDQWNKGTPFYHAPSATRLHPTQSCTRCNEATDTPVMG